MGRLVLVSIAAVVHVGCGLGPFAGESGGGDNLPTAAIGPYGKLSTDQSTPVEEPIVLADQAADFLEPSFVVRDDGGFRVFVERRGNGGGEIYAAELPSLREFPDVAPHVVLASSQAWEEGDLRAPSVAIDEDTGDVLLAYEAGAPSAIGVTRSTDGETFANAASPSIASARSPSIAMLDGVAYLMFERTDREGIYVASSSDGETWQERPAPVLLRGTTPEAFDRAAIEHPHLIVRRTPTGRVRFDVFYQGRTGELVGDDAEIAIGYAGGFDLDVLVKAPPVDEPILNGDAPSEDSPSVVIEPTRGVMLYVDRVSSRSRIGAATSP